MIDRTLFIDGQVFQSAAWDRGMGKYSLALLKALTQNKNFNYKNTYIIFTKNMPLKPASKELIKDAAPDVEHIYADLKIPTDPATADIPELQRHNQAVLDQLTKGLGDTDNFCYLMLALFIDQVCSVFPTVGQKVLLFYDLIPFQYNERYSILSSYENYLARYKSIFETDLIMTISQTVADDVAMNLGIPQPKIININGAPIKRITSQAKKPRLKLPKRFLLMPSGDEIRKNNVRAVQGFETYRQSEQQQGVALVLTSHFHESTKNTLRTYSKDIIFTDNVTEEELLWLYENAEALLFVPEYEGLGLPILEAAGAGLPIVCSNLTVFNEISPTAFYYADPLDPFSIASGLKQALSKTDFKQKLKEYPDILKRYTWDNTADLAIQALSKDINGIKRASKLKLAVFAPSPSGYSAIGKLVMQMHPTMSEYFDIEYYVEESKSHQDFKRPDYLPYVSKVRPAAEFDRRAYRKYDAILYHIGNSEFHMETIKNALYLPGYAIFHDTHLKYVFEGALSSYGYMDEERLDAERLLDKKINNPQAEYISSIVNNQRAMVAHSNYTQRAVEDSSIGKNTETIKLDLPTVTPKQTIQKKNESQITIGLAGIIHPAKGLDVVEQLAQTYEFYDCKIHIFGLSLVPEETISRLQAYPNVQVDTDVTDFQFQNMLSQVDILINFRTEYRGETSLATIEAMRFGVVPIVKKIGWYDELPDDAVVKVNDSVELINELTSIIHNPAMLATMSAAAKKYVADKHTYLAYAQNLYNFISGHSDENKPDVVADEIKRGASLNTLLRLLAGR